MVRRFFLKLFFSFFLGFIASFFIFQNSLYVRSSCAFYIKNYLQSFTDSTVNCNVKKIDIFSPKLVLGDVSFAPLDHRNWSWKCSKLVVDFSWFDFLLYGTVALDLELHNARADSLVDGSGIAIAKHLVKFYQGSSIVPIFLRSCSLVSSSIITYDITSKNRADFFANVEIKNKDNVIKFLASLYDGKTVVNNVLLYKNSSAKMRADITLESRQYNIKLDTNGTVHVPRFDKNETTYFSGSWNYDHGLFSINNEDRSFIVSPIKLYLFGKNLVAELSSHFPLHCFDKNLSGLGFLSFHSEINKKDYKLSANIAAKNVRYKNKYCADIGSCNFRRTGGAWKGAASFTYKKNDICKGLWSWSEKSKKGTVKIENTGVLSSKLFPYWSILPQQSYLLLTYSSLFDCNMSYFCSAVHEKNNAIFSTSGKATYKNNNFFLKGDCHNNVYCIESTVFPKIALKKCSYKEQESGKKIELSQKKENQFEAVVDVDVMRKAVNSFFGVDVQAEGNLRVQADLKDEFVFFKCSSIDTTIRLPHTYNFINNFSTDITANLKKRTIKINNFACCLQQGRCHLTDGIIEYNSYFKPTFVHGLFLFNDCWLHWENDFYALLSGALLYKHSLSDSGKISGNIFLDHVRLHANIASLQKNSFFNTSNFANAPLDVICDIVIETKSPVIVKTDFLKTKADIDLHIWGKLLSPDILGGIRLRSGVLYFPYKPLYIKRGLINFLPGKLLDPLIELHAKNKLKKYIVSLDVAGSALFPHITLSASPGLSEEQIVALLLVGSEKESLHSLMPALLMKNVKSMLFNSWQKDESNQTPFKKILQSFKKVHFVPSFSDQTARGGLRGLVEIDINDQWRASLQKNFSLSEDTRFELEYFVSDEISVQGIRNERGDITTNMQMRWKF